MDIIEQIEYVLENTKTFKSKKRKVLKILRDNNLIFYIDRCVKSQNSYYKNLINIYFMMDNEYYKIFIDYIPGSSISKIRDINIKIESLKRDMRNNILLSYTSKLIINRNLYNILFFNIITEH